MFTGIIEAVQPIKSNISVKQGRRISIPLGKLSEDARVGDSICVNGVCLTISELSGELGVFDVMAETARVSTLEQLKPPEPVNLERALPSTGRFGGHIVQGHVDGIGRIKQVKRGGGQYLLYIEAENEMIEMMIAKGSVAVDGVSLTIVEVKDHSFSVSLIPTTLELTNLGRRKTGDRVNLEADLISKWIKQRLDQILPRPNKDGKITMEKLRQQGFI
ncbi:MAG: hypothetical protein AMJ79_05080 [Phycisphaerae bacterium SM23_30]|nr:MAG: hypothetical protein AMJ79_05080 [Phycisphaerae bacterium SM23_30]